MRHSESGTLAAVAALRADVLDPRIDEFGGRIFKVIGDGFLAEFGSAVDAVEAALAIQTSLADGSAPLQLRIGLNLGDVVIQNDDVFGDGVNVASRLEGIAEPGGIVVSGSVHDQTAGRIEVEFEDIGLQSLKNIDQPVQAYAVRPPQGSRREPAAPAAPAGGPPVIAVLPFTNMSSNPDDEYFSDGLTEDIITELARFRDCRVIARNSTFQFRGRAVDISQVGRELKADYVVEGSVRRAGARLRVTAQLIESTNGTHLWADRYDRGIEDVFDVQDELTRTIAATVGVRLQGAGIERSMTKHPKDLGAYDCVLRARRFTVGLDNETHREARDLLERAVTLDPNYADAFALLANIYLAEHRFEFNPLPNSMSRALRAARRAVELDPHNAHAHCWLAITHFFRRENERFLGEMNKALALNPNDPGILAEAGHYHAFMGQGDKGARYMDQAIAMNPLHPGWYHFTYVIRNLQRHDYEAMLREVENVNLPEFYWSWLFRAAALGHLGRREEGERAIGEMQALKPDIDARVELLKWNTAYDDLEHVMDGLQKAGLTTER